MLGLLAPALRIRLELNPQRHLAWPIAGVFRCLPLAIFPDVVGDETSTAGGSIVEMLGQVGEYTFEFMCAISPNGKVS